jgi:hypothetical protein
MLRLPTWRWPFARASTSVYCVLVFPDFTESRWFDRVPTPGTRLRHQADWHWARTYVVDEVLQSGTETYTVFLVDRRQYVRNLRERSEGDLAPELLELARKQRRLSMRYVGDGERGTTCPERPTGPSGRTLSAGVGAATSLPGSLCALRVQVWDERHLVTGQTATRCLSSS